MNNNNLIKRHIVNLKMIGNRIRFLRINYTNLSQEDFAQTLGFDRTYISRIEVGKQNVTVETLIKICEKGLKISMEDFFNFDKIEIDTMQG
jgi:transcriptional regulator with XRE-family HTH domain